MILVSGEAGLGKTTLVAETARAAFDAGACVLFGHCEEDLATPYQLFAEALGSLRHARAGGASDRATSTAHGSELAGWCRRWRAGSAELAPSKATDADTERYLLFAAVVGLLRHGVGASAGRARARRLAVGRRGQPATPPPLDRIRGGDAPVGARARIATARCRTPVPCARRSGCSAGHDGVSRIELVGPRRHRRGVVHGGRRRSRARGTASSSRTRCIGRPTATRSS